jgi:CelD/BcsL family acetyltransferase involved in cellulose biosynthesis
MIEVLTNPAALPGLIPEWTALWKRTAGATPFSSPAWLMPWWQIFGTEAPVVACLYQGRSLAGILPLYVLHETDGRKLLPVGAGVTDYVDALLAPDAPADAVRELAHAALEKGAGNGAAICDLTDIPPGSALRGVCAPPGWQISWRRADPCPVLLHSDAIPARQQRKLRMNRHRADRLGGWRVVRAANDDLPHLMDALLLWNEQRGHAPDASAQRFFRNAASSLSAAGLLRLCALQAGDDLAAVCFALEAGKDRLLFYLIGFNPRLAPISPGSLLLGAMIETAWQEGRQELHFLRGGESYKHAWGAEDRFNAACHMRKTLR